MFYFCSDPHYAHKNIVRGTSNWQNKEGTRDFTTLDEHNQALIDGINNTVKQDDTLYLLGDFAFGKSLNIIKFRKAINCTNVHLILGNHDEIIRANTPIIFNKSQIGEKELDALQDEEQSLYPRSLFSSVQDYLSVYINGQYIVMCHYAMRVWHKNAKGSWMLYGHSHDNLEYEEWGKSMDVGFDAAKRILGSYKPFSFNQIKQIMDNRNILALDHHK